MNDAKGTTKVMTVSPMIAVGKMDEAISFYSEVLGFEPLMKSPGYSIVRRDGQLIHLQTAAADDVMKTVRDHTEIYIQVDGIAKLWEHVKLFKDRYQIRDLFEREYGMTEFHISDPNSCLIFVGEVTTE